ncbi:MAG: helix-turn-helix domain-containing protein [Oscillospiraceae bacterium]|nr:helix-turn-helix domain-containing protein [Oscillospiraceae bacterium]
MAHGLYNALADREHNTLGRTLKAVRKAKRLSQHTLRQRLEQHGVSVQIGAISKWETGETIPNAYQFLALCRVLGFEDVMEPLGWEPNPDKLALNEAGLARLAEYRKDLIASGRYRPSRRETAEIRYVDMPVSLLPVSAGTGAFLDEQNFEAVSFPEALIPRGAEFGVRVSGDSMEPVYHDGQIVWVKRCDALRPGEVGIFLYDGDGYIKVYSEDAAARRPVLISYNKRYAPISVQPDSGFYIAGRVLN